MWVNCNLPIYIAYTHISFFFFLYEIEFYSSLIYVYMCVKLPILETLTPFLTSTYTYGVTLASKVRGGTLMSSNFVTEIVV